MRRHRPNRFSAVVRILAIAGASLLLLYGLAELAIGVSYIPVKRAGLVLLSGTATLLIAMGVLLMCAACLLVVADHYDRRDNEPLYAFARKWLGLAGLGLLLLAPLSELVFALLHALAGIDVPDYRGFARDATWHNPALVRYAPWLESTFDGRFVAVVLIASILALAASLAFQRWGGALARRIGFALAGACMIGFAVLLSTMVLIHFISGSTLSGSHRGGRQITAAAEPAKFNAALLTGSIASGVLLLAGIGSIGVSFMREP